MDQKWRVFRCNADKTGSLVERFQPFKWITPAGPLVQPARDVLQEIRAKPSPLVVGRDHHASQNQVVGCLNQPNSRHNGVSVGPVTKAVDFIFPANLTEIV